MVFKTLNVREEGAVLFAGTAAPPMNLLGPDLGPQSRFADSRAEAGEAFHLAPIPDGNVVGRQRRLPYRATVRLFSTAKTPDTSRARTSAICRSAALSTTPKSIVRPFFTMMWIG